MKTKVLINLPAAAALAFAASLGVVMAVPDAKLSDFKLGEHVAGEETNLDRLRGKVVAIEYWGTR